MFSRGSLWLLITGILLSCSETTHEEPFTRLAVVKGKITQYGELGDKINQFGAVVTLKGGSVTLTATTDIEGNYTIGEVPIGTFNLTAVKGDNGSMSLKNIRVLGGPEPVYVNGLIYGSSKTKVSNLGLEFDALGGLRVTGALSSSTNVGTNNLACVVFFGSDPNVSSTNYKQFFKAGSVNSIISQNGGNGYLVYIDKSIYPSGTKLYAVAYGQFFNVLMWSEERARYEYVGLGTVPSNVVSVNVP